MLGAALVVSISAGALTSACTPGGSAKTGVPSTPSPGGSTFTGGTIPKRLHTVIKSGTLTAGATSATPPSGTTTTTTQAK